MAAKKKAALEGTQHFELGVDIGSVLRLVASRYPTLLLAHKEAVQNSLDEDATIISCVLNQKTGYYALRDNGNGVAAAKFGDKMKNMCRTQKGRGKIGRHGMGFGAFLGKCKYFTFTTCPRDGAEPYRRYTFVTKDIFAMSKEPTIPGEVMEKLAYAPMNTAAPKGKEGVWWRSQVEVFDFTSDSVIGRIESIDELEQVIMREFKITLLRQNVVLNIKLTDKNGAVHKREGIKAQPWTGEPLEKVVLRNKKVGHVVFELFRAHKVAGGKKAEVVVGEIGDDTRIEFGRWAADQGGVPTEIVDALTAGDLEGQITGLNIRLESGGSRKYFERNETIAGYLEAIEEWWTEYGEPLLEEFRAEKRVERWSDIFERSLANFASNLETNPAYRDWRDLLNFEQKQDEDSPESGVVTVKPTPEPVDDSDRAEPEPRDDADPAEPRKHRKQVRRALSKPGAFGLRLSTEPTEEMLQSNMAYFLDARMGLLRFNTRHPVWVACDERSALALQQYQELALHCAIAEYVQPAEDQEAARRAFNDLLVPLVTGCFHNSNAFVLALRRSDRKKED